VLIGDPEAIERFRFLAVEAVANLPPTFWIRPPLFPTQLPHLAEESRLHRWAEFVLIASCGSWHHKTDDPATPKNRYSFTVRNAFGASSDAIPWILGDPTRDASLHQLNASRLLAIFNGEWWKHDFMALGDALKTCFKRKQNPFTAPKTADEREPYWREKRAEVDALRRRLAAAGAEINDRVYRLFALTAEEVALLKREVEH